MAGRLRRSDPHKAGLTRRRRGKGFTFYDVGGSPVHDKEVVERLKSLAIPPAWTDVWICADPQGHLQATGVDNAGRRQYLYHPRWRERRDAAKFAHMQEVAGALAKVRTRIASDLTGRTLTRRRVLAATAHLLDTAVIRVGGESYARDDPKTGEATFGLATLRRDHVSVRGSTVDLRFEAKGGISAELSVADRPLATVVKRLLDRDDDNPELFGYHDRSGWHDVTSRDVNDYLREVSGIELTAKDFRTWHGTVAAAVSLACAGPAKTVTAQRRTIAAAMRDVAELLGNTPAVARKSYVDPRVLDAYRQGDIIKGLGCPDVSAAFTDRKLWDRAERATLDLLGPLPSGQ